ncbi:MAG: polyprenyl synthetase family protein [Planctomycetota bacterium]
MTPTGLAQSLAGIKPRLDALEELLDEQFSSEVPHVREMLAYARSYSGKRLRPALVFVIADLCGGAREEHVRLAAVVEMIHLATLVHDDVIDRATMRRRATSINARWTDKDAVLLGDVIFSRAISLLVSLGDPRALAELTACVGTLCEGEIHQNRLAGDASVDTQTYLSIIRKKTASLYGVGCELAAHLAEASPRVVQAFGRFGIALGTGFQIIDDCLDLSGDEEVVGKSLGSDVANGKMTLPLIHLLGQLEGEERREVREIIESRRADASDVLRIRRLIAERGSVEFATGRAEAYVEEALADLRGLLGSTATPILDEIAGFVLRRRA